MKAEVFQHALQAFQQRIKERGNSAFGGLGEHDDLVIAAALVCWWAETGQRVGVRHAT